MFPLSTNGKLRIQANKIKQVLRDNTDDPVFVDSLYDDMNYQSHISRSLFKGMCDELFKRRLTGRG